MIKNEDKSPEPEDDDEAVMINPEDGLHQGMAELREKLGIRGFLDALEKAIPPKTHD